MQVEVEVEGAGCVWRSSPHQVIVSRIANYSREQCTPVHYGLL